MDACTWPAGHHSMRGEVNGSVPHPHPAAMRKGGRVGPHCSDRVRCVCYSIIEQDRPIHKNHRDRIAAARRLAASPRNAPRPIAFHGPWPGHFGQARMADCTAQAVHRGLDRDDAEFEITASVCNRPGRRTCRRRGGNSNRKTGVPASSNPSESGDGRQADRTSVPPNVSNTA